MWKNPERKKEYQKEYYAKNRDRIIEQNKEWKKQDYKRDPVKYKKFAQKYRLENLEYVRKYNREYKKINPVGIYGTIRSCAKKRNKEFLLTKDEFVKWWNENKECFYCGVRIEAFAKLKDSMSLWSVRMTVDRLDNDGAYELGNIVLACRRCNSIKGDFFTWREMKEIADKYIRPKR